MIFYELTPIDTLFFRGNTPMEAGQFAETLFPPPPSVFIGAIRTMLGKEHYNDSITISAILLKKDDNIYYPAPYSWFYDENDKDKKLYEAKNKQFNNETLTSLGNELPWLEIDDLKSVGGKWVTSYDITKAKLYEQSDFYKTESRVGIALDYKKYTAKEGHLFSANHIRLEEKVSIVIGIETETTLNEKGILQLGGEMRKAEYKKLKTQIEIPNNISLAPIVATKENLKYVFATGKIIYASGWDLEKKCHKSSQAYFSAGTVFNKPIKEIL